MLRLRPYKKCDAEAVVKWLGDERAFRLWCADRYESFPITADDMNKYYEQFAFSDGFFPFTAFDENGAAGHLIMRFTDEERKTVRFGFIIVDSARRGKGYGRQMIELALRYAREFLGAERVTIGVFEQNVSAVKCYGSAGFSATGEYETLEILGEQWKCIELETGGQL